MRLLLVFLAATFAANAGILWDNGPAVQSSGLCNSGPNTCGGTGQWEILDDFQITAPSIITGFQFDAYYAIGGPSDYQSSSMGLSNGDPFNGGQNFVGVGALMAQAPGAAGSTRFTVTGLSIAVGPGTYWFSMTHRLLNGALTTAALSSSTTLSGYKQTDRGGIQSNFSGNTAFTVLGDAAVPEPATGLLLGAGLLAVSVARRKRN